MTYKQSSSNWLKAAEKQLVEAGIETARLDALVLLGDVLGKDKSWLLAYPQHEVQGSEIEILNKKVAQRCTHTPLAYLRGRVEFYGREFLVNDHVLVPRPESEAMIELLKAVDYGSDTHIYDIGTGSGCLAITAQLELPLSKVTAVDIDENCLKLAQKNAAHLGANITFIQSDLLQSVSIDSDQAIILANLPYVPESYPINEAAKHEPALALFSGEDGLDHYRTLFSQVEQSSKKPVCIITESLHDQHPKLVQIAARHGYLLAAEQDLAQCFRYEPKADQNRVIVQTK